MVDKLLRCFFVACLGLFFSQSSAEAIDFKIRGQFQMGFGAGINSMVDKASGEKVNSPISNDTFKARQRFRLWLDAVASENLSGTVNIEMGHIRWGQASSGGALGADGTIVKLRQAYIDWRIPETEIGVRMGLQTIGLPSAAGESQVLRNDTSVAAIVASAPINENIGVTAGWLRPYNDNYDGAQQGYLDNFDLFLLSVPFKWDALEVTPWAMYGMMGQNTFKVRNGNGGYNYVFTGYDGGNLVGSLGAIPFGNVNQPHGSGPAYNSIFWFGVPVKWSPDPLNLELDFTYGYVEANGRYTVDKSWYGEYTGSERANSKREGWLFKALAEYKLDWGTPGVFGWYASGDDGNLKNGSERIPYLYTRTTLTSVIGDDPVLYGGIGGNARSSSYDGTWGIGAKIKDVSFLPDVKHMLRVAYMEGTNSTSMVKYANFLSRGVYNPCIAWQGVPGTDDFYLTTQDKLLEFDFQTVINLYENFKIGIEFDYLVNMLDKDTWKKAANTTFSKQDMWVADVQFMYTF